MAGALGLSNRRLPSGQFDTANREYLLETGEFLRTAEDVRNVVAGVASDKPIFVRDVAEVSDGGEEPSQYVRMARRRIRASSCPPSPSPSPSARARMRSWWRSNVLQRIEPLKGSVIPAGCAGEHHAAITARPPPKNPTNCCSTC